MYNYARLLSKFY